MKRRTAGPAALAVALTALMLTSCGSPLEEATPGTPPAEAESSGTADDFDRDGALADQLDEARNNLLVRFPSAAVPEVALVRIISLEEWPGVNAACMTDQGFPSTVSTGGGVESRVLPAQAEAHAVAGYICDASYPVDPKFSVPLSDEQLSALYEYFTETLTPCLEGEGVDIGDAPSESSFIATYNTDQSWTPYLDAMDLDVVELEKTCPQAPADLYG